MDLITKPRTETVLVTNVEIHSVMDARVGFTLYPGDTFRVEDNGDLTIVKVWPDTGNTEVFSFSRQSLFYHSAMTHLIERPTTVMPGQDRPTAPAQPGRPAGSPIPPAPAVPSDRDQSLNIGPPAAPSSPAPAAPSTPAASSGLPTDATTDRVKAPRRSRKNATPA